MSATPHALVFSTPALSSPASWTALPWQPCDSAEMQSPPSSPPPGSVADPWAKSVARVPYLSQARFSAFSVVYKPPTVIQLSEATGCSVSDLAGAYNDLPVIRLSKEIADDVALPVPSAETEAFDSLDYLRLEPLDETLEMATNAVRARRPVPDAEETFWEADYWEKLKRIKQEQQQRKDQRRQTKKIQERTKELVGASISAMGMPSTYTLGNSLSAMNSPSFTTPHSRQGSLSGHAGEVDTSPTMAALQSAQRQKKIAKGLLRRARYNESHNPSHAQLNTTRSVSILSQNSAGAGPQQQQQQSVIRCRTRPRSYSTNSQQTDVRGFQYSISSAMSEGGRSALSDSLRTPPLLSINGVPLTREALTTSLDLELSASGGVTKSGATTRSRNSAVTNGRGGTTTPSQITPPREKSEPLQRSFRLRVRTGSRGVNEVSPSPLSCDSKRSSPRIKTREAATDLSDENNPSAAQVTRSAASAGIAAAPPTLTIIPASSSSRAEGGAANVSSWLPSGATPALQITSNTATTTATVELAPTPLTEVGNAAVAPTTPPSSGPGRTIVNVHRKPTISHSTTEGTRAVMEAGPASRSNNTEHLSPAAPRSYHATTASVGSNAVAGGAARSAKSEPLVSVTAGNEATSLAPTLPVHEADQSKATSGISSPLSKGSNAHPTVAMIPHPKKPKESTVDAKENILPPNKNDNGDRQSAPGEAAAGPAACAGQQPRCATSTRPPQPPPHPEQRGSPTTVSPIPSTSTQGPSAQDSSPAKSTTLTATPSGSATPRATATTVPPSRTPTREASMSPRLERAIAVHSTTPASPNIPVGLQPATSRDGAPAAASTPDTSLSLSIVTKQLSRPLPRATLREDSTATSASPAPPPQCSETTGHTVGPSSSPTFHKTDPQRIAPVKDTGNGAPSAAATNTAVSKNQTSPSTAGGTVQPVGASTAFHGATRPYSTLNSQTSVLEGRTNGEPRPAFATAAAATSSAKATRPATTTATAPKSTTKPAGAKREAASPAAKHKGKNDVACCSVV